MAEQISHHSKKTPKKYFQDNLHPDFWMGHSLRCLVSNGRLGGCKSGTFAVFNLLRQVASLGVFTKISDVYWCMLPDEMVRALHQARQGHL